MTALALAVMVACGGASPLPECPVKRVAHKALRGDYGKLEGWQREGYRSLAKGHRRLSAWRTFYTPSEPGGRTDCKGRRCTTRTAAANSLPQGAYVLDVRRGQLRQVRDRGAKRNDRVARAKGAQVWVDFWTPNERLRLSSGVIEIAVAEERNR